MTQKELLYLEDAVNHEKSIISIIKNTIKNLEDKNLIDYMNQEIEKHNTIKNNLLNLLEENTNE